MTVDEALDYVRDHYETHAVRTVTANVAMVLAEEVRYQRLRIECLQHMVDVFLGRARANDT